MTQQVQFIYLSQADFDGLETKQDNRIYFISDTHKIYRGSVLYATTSFDDLQFSGGQIQVEQSSIQVDGVPVSLEGHTHTLGDISGWDDLSFNFANISVSSLTVDGNQVSLEGHTHTLGDLTGLSEATLSISGVMASSIVANEILVGANAVSLDGHTHSASEITGWDDIGLSFTDIEVSSLLVNGSSVSLEGHTHTASEITNWEGVTLNLSGISVSQISTDGLLVGGQTVAFSNHNHNVSNLEGWESANLTLEGMSLQNLSTDNLLVGGQAVAFSNHAHSASEITGWDQIDFGFGNISVSSLLVDGTPVSLDGHTHTLSQITDIDGANLHLGNLTTGVISASGISIGSSQVSLEGHSHSASEITGWEDAEITIGDMSVTNLFVDDILVAGKAVAFSDHSHSASEITGWDEIGFPFTDIEVSSILVNGSSVSLEGHTHNIDDIVGLQDSIPSKVSELENDSGFGKAFNTISLIKPYSQEPLFINMSISTSPSFDSYESVSSKTKAGLFQGFDSSNWIQQPSTGFGVEFNNQPIVFLLANYLKNDSSLDVNENSTLYLKYSWYWVDEDTNNHESDTYSMVYPTATEVGANSRDVVTKREYTTLEQEFKPIKTPTSGTQFGSINRYSAYTTQFNEFGILSVGDQIVLQDYNFSNRYQMSFTTPNTSSASTIQFCVDLGNGPEFDSTMNINGNNSFFKSNTTYSIEVRNDTIIVNSINGKNVLQHTQELMANNSSSVKMRVWMD